MACRMDLLCMMTVTKSDRGNQNRDFSLSLHQEELWKMAKAGSKTSVITVYK